MLGKLIAVTDAIIASRTDLQEDRSRIKLSRVTLNSAKKGHSPKVRSSGPKTILAKPQRANERNEINARQIEHVKD